MSDPQVYVLESSDDGPFAPPPSVERQKEVLALWRRFCTSDPEHLGIFWWFIRALDAQHAERTRAEAEKTREALMPVRDFLEGQLMSVMKYPSHTKTHPSHFREALTNINDVLRQCALSIEGTGQ